jgi:sucrose-6-phosphate hydrolase SacC (GH32 family)
MRIYAAALDGAELAGLRPNEAGARAPWAWWRFEGTLADEAGRFKAAALQGIAEVRDGHLRLYGGTMMAAQRQDDLASIVPPVVDPELTRDIERARALRHKLLADPDRPTYHFVIPEDYAMPFDPNGAIFWKGRYHLFYIYQDRGVHKFGHVSSLDLVHWRHHREGVVPTADSPEKGIFSGNCFVNRRGEATMVYHGVGAGNCMATSGDDWLDEWTKLPTNPYLPPAPEGAPYRSWDPFGWIDGDWYYTISGGERAAVFKARELTDKWSYVGDFLHHTVPGVDLREDISCADFFKLGGKDVLICISHRLGARYYVGEWRGEQFHPEAHERMSWNDNLYFAPETLEDDRGRRILWAWIFDQRKPAVRQASGWSGELSLPREVWLGEDNRLRMRPVEELKRLRFDERGLGEDVTLSDSEQALDGLGSDAYELEVEVAPGGASAAGLRVCRQEDGGGGMDILLDTVNHKLIVGNEAAPFEVRGGKATLRVFVDRSVVEVFADDRQAAVRRHYPARRGAFGVALVARGGGARFANLKRWRMFPANAH